MPIARNDHAKFLEVPVRLPVFLTIRNMHQKELATQLGFKNSAFVSQVLNGKKIFSLKRITQICKLLEITEAQLLGTEPYAF